MISAKLAQFVLFAPQVSFVAGRWGMGHGGMHGSKGEMMELIHQLLDTEDIKRNVTETAEGIESYTRSDDPDVASWIQTHVHQMKTLMESEYGGIRLWDEIFETLFDLRDSHEMQVENVADGVRVVQKLSDGVDDNEAVCVIASIQEHAKVVSKFVDLGWGEMHENHPMPDECA